MKSSVCEIPHTHSRPQYSPPSVTSKTEMGFTRVRGGTTSVYTTYTTSRAHRGNNARNNKKVRDKLAGIYMYHLSNRA